MVSGKNSDVHFGSFQLRLTEGRLLCGDDEVRLRPKAWKVLCFLSARPAEIISIGEILDNCWGDLHVTQHALTNVIYALRGVFEAGDGSADWIESIPRRGYRFMAPIEAAPKALAAAAAALPLVPDDGQLFVGRKRQIAVLEQSWQHVLSGIPKIVFISGEPGIGKTALVERFLVSAGVHAGSPSTVLLTHGRCIPLHREAEPYLPMLEALGSLASVAGVIDIIREQAPTWLIQMPWLVSAEDRRSLRQGLEGIGPARMLREGRRLFATLAKRLPVLLVLEDLHWADSASIDLIRSVAEIERPSRLMLIATYRSSEAVAHNHPLCNLVSELASRSRQIETLPLEPLSPALVREYLGRRFANPALAAEIAPLLEVKSGGNPLFLGAMSDYLCEQDRIACGEDGWRLKTKLSALDVGLPDGLREMVRTHLRQLGPEQARALEAASAVGDDFTTMALAASLMISASEAEEMCEGIAVGGHFIRAIGQVAWPDGSIGEHYRFAHAVYRQVMSDDTPPSRRRLLHARIGERLAAGFGKRAREIAPRLAAHFEAAADLEQELEYLRLSVQLAAGRYAHRETLAYMDRTLDVLGRLAATDENAALQLGWQAERGNLLMESQGYGAAFDSFARVVELARRQSHSFLEFIGHAGCALSGLMGRNHRAAAQPEAQAVLAISADGHPELVAAAQLLAGSVADSFGDPQRGLVHAEAALAALPNALRGVPRGFEIKTFIHILFLTCRTRLGQLDRARQERERVIHGAENESGLGGKAHGFAFVACDALISSEPALALEYAQRAIVSAREGGFEHFADVGEAVREAAVSMLAADDRIDADGLERFAAVIAKRHRLGENWYNMLLSGYLADAYRRGGDLHRARAQIEASFANAEEVYLPELLRIKAEIELASASPMEVAAECFRSAMLLARQHGTKLFELRAADGLASLKRGEGGSGRDLATVYHSFSEGLGSDDMRHAAHTLRALHIEVGQGRSCD